jgi:NADH-quinone oxidoreductase subunit A
MAEGTLAYVPLVVLAVVAFLLVFMTLLGQKFLAPQRASVRKVTNYECGEQATPHARGPIDVQYYMFVLTFLIFDVEAMFLIPFAMRFKDLSAGAVVAVGIFVGLILVGYAWELRKRLLTWRTMG